ncbi:hypothetical protein BT63DRAFT_461486 [Microthyrium microscopicum]|uniref:Uncharacterized protein n=1 Tax=Microthyrium microscopicum TaxID=703497 RepID=A0A6A6TWY5_9PEZI|nr:hypothetical protein BT63DRAFT_461486 [Microthyrium microscopicum]
MLFSAIFTILFTAIGISHAIPTGSADAASFASSENPGAVLKRASNEWESTNCSGSAFCELLGASCDVAYQKIDPTNTYDADKGKNYSGVCSGTCGIFFKGSCSGTGRQLMDAYNEIRDNGHCTHCGTTLRSVDQCLVKIDRVPNCAQ